LHCELAQCAAEFYSHVIPSAFAESAAMLPKMSQGHYRKFRYFRARPMLHAQAMLHFLSVTPIGWARAGRIRYVAASML
jgi:hypothetical protein